MPFCLTVDVHALFSYCKSIGTDRATCMHSPLNFNSVHGHQNILHLHFSMSLSCHGRLNNSGALCSSKGRMTASRWPRTSNRNYDQLRLTHTSRRPKVSVHKSAPRWSTMHPARWAPPTRVSRRLLLVQAAQNAVAFCKCEANPGLLTFRNFCSVSLCDGVVVVRGRGLKYSP